jgi:hypothetical protein
MNVGDLNRFAYVKRPLNGVFKEGEPVPPEYLMDWLKDTHDYIRLHSDEELERFKGLSAEEILVWLEEAADFVWEANKHLTSFKSNIEK